jgi:hypothetical protein
MATGGQATTQVTQSAEATAAKTQGKGKAKLDPQASHQYEYRGPAKTFRVAEGAEPIGKGDKVTLTNAQVRLLMKSGHVFKADSAVAQATIDAGRGDMEAERRRLEAEAAAKKAAG